MVKSVFIAIKITCCFQDFSVNFEICVNYQRFSTFHRKNQYAVLRHIAVLPHKGKFFLLCGDFLRIDAVIFNT